MAEPHADARASKRKRDKVEKLLQESYNKGELALKHAIGLGATQNVIPPSPSVMNGPARTVDVGWHPVGGFAGKWFAEKTGLGKLITEKIRAYPDPTQHWAVLVGEYAHQLWMDENFDIIYTNARIIREEWRTFTVGHTCFNDSAVQRTGEHVISKIRETRPGYNLITNNCQTYVLQLLDAIRVSHAKHFGTTLAVYERLVGPGSVKDLFPDASAAPESQGVAVEATGPPLGAQESGVIGATGTGVHDTSMQPDYSIRPDYLQYQQDSATSTTSQDSVLLAQQVMNANTTQLNAEEEMGRHMSEDEHKSGWRKSYHSFLGKLKK